MTQPFDDFMSQLKETLCPLKDYVDFRKVTDNVDLIAAKLNLLNYLLGQQDMAKAVNTLWAMNPEVFSVLDILIAVRTRDKKKAVDTDGNCFLISDCFSSPEKVVMFLDNTGLTELFQKQQIKNLVDYVFGVEVGLDSNARKNRGGDLMENLVAGILSKHGVAFEREVNYNCFPEVVRVLGIDKKRFDFVVRGKNKTYLIETNFYSGGGSKLNEVARAYSELAPKINAIPGYEFVWITDGVGWKDARSKIEEAWEHIPSIYNLTNIIDFIKLVKS